jgi:type VI secretion system protein ImpC
MQSDEERQEEAVSRPFVIDVIGDFRESAEDAPKGQAGPLSGRRFMRVDRDNFNEILGRFKVCWAGKLRDLPGESGVEIPIELTFGTLEDFDPHQIVQSVAPLRRLLETREALEDPARFDQAAADVARWERTVTKPGQATEKPSGPPEAPAEVEASELLDLILNKQDAPAKLRSEEHVSRELDQLVREAVAPHAIHIDSASQERLIAAVDCALSEQVRTILHDPVFQRLEAAWRGLHWLVRSAETDASLKIRIAHISKKELFEDMLSSEDLEVSGFARLVLGPAAIPGGEPASLLVGNYSFDHSLEDLALLERIGNIAMKLQAPFFAAAGPGLLGCPSFAEMPEGQDLRGLFETSDYEPWQMLRQSACARWLALALPRLLGRLPYGKETNPVESFGFEEGATQPKRAEFLWENPAFALAVAVAGAFAADGWSMDVASTVQRLDGLPLFVYRNEDGESMAMPCAEAYLDQRTVDALGEAGLVPLVSCFNTDAVALPCMQTLAEPRFPISWQ